MRDYLATQRVIAKCDRSEDPHSLIDDVRQELDDQKQIMKMMASDIVWLKDNMPKKMTDSGIWRITKIKLAEQRTEWTTWAVRGTLATLGGGLFLGFLALCRLAWKGLNAK